jgi:hypothetical protein
MDDTEKRLLRRIEILEARLRYDAARALAMLMLAIGLLAAATGLVVDWDASSSDSDADAFQLGTLLFLLCAVAPLALYLRHGLEHRWVSFFGAGVIAVVLLLVWGIVDEIDGGTSRAVYLTVAGLLAAMLVMFAPPAPGPRP